MITTVKYLANIDIPTIHIGYFINNSISTGLDNQEVQTWISEGNTPEDAYTQAELDAYAIQSNTAKIDERLASITVVVGGNEYAGSPKVQGELAFAIQILTDRIAGETLAIRTVDGFISKLNLDDFKTIQNAISNKQEAIFVAEEHVYVDAAGNIVTK